MTSFVRQVAAAAMLNYRQTLREIGLILGFVVLFPVGFLFFLGLVVRTALLTQVVVGSLMMETALLNVNVLAQGIGNDKQQKIYDLWVSLPVSPVVYVVANALSLLPFSLLSAVVTLTIGVLYFGVALPLATLPLLLGAFLLVWASTLGIGFLIGVYGRSPRQINTIAQFVGIIMTFFAPVFYPLSVLPPALRYVAELWPITWGSAFMEDILVNAWGPATIAAAVLVAFTAGGFVLIGAGLRWRQP